MRPFAVFVAFSAMLLAQGTAEAQMSGGPPGHPAAAGALAPRPAHLGEFLQGRRSATLPGRWSRVEG